MRQLSLFCTLTVFIYYSLFPFAETDMRGSATENFISNNLHFYMSQTTIRHSTRKPVYVHVHLVNRGIEPVTIYLHRNFLRNITFILKDQEGKIVPPKAQIESRESLDKEYYYSNYTQTNFHSRAIVLQPNEIFERKVNLQQVFDLSNAMKAKRQADFSLHAIFYPNPEQMPKYHIFSQNKLDFILQNENSPLPQFIPEATGEEPLALTPEETIYLMLSAEYQARWQSFFKYIRLKDFILAYPIFARKWQKASKREKPYVMRQFKMYLMNQKAQKLHRFEILPRSPKNPEMALAKLEDDREKGVATVKVKAVREYDGFQREFLYTYYLTAIGRFWKVTGVETTLIR
ncbi:MAG: hypothetical protein D6767_02620 [Candidatus Hydrogenedentota bacterium]|nr:MAG: hypothetical protein D6767_02620 [Candidatus Hydrogenedentota bacterium]